ncbi:MAG: hypothetical protein N4A47_03415 [Clostridia bacterium]|jgi:hypothetical protein|nr:hypothetical protein [Clostridia bacterium]
MGTIKNIIKMFGRNSTGDINQDLDKIAEGLSGSVLFLEPIEKDLEEHFIDNYGLEKYNGINPTYTKVEETKYGFIPMVNREDEVAGYVVEKLTGEKLNLDYVESKVSANEAGIVLEFNKLVSEKLTGEK